MNIRGGDRVMALIRESQLKVRHIAIDEDDEITSVAFHGVDVTLNRVVSATDAGRREEWQIHGVDDDGNDTVMADDELTQRVESVRRDANGLARKVDLLRYEARVIEQMMALAKKA